MTDRDMAELGRAILIQTQSVGDKLAHLLRLEKARSKADGITELDQEYAEQESMDAGHRIARALTEITAELDVANEHLEDQTRAQQLWALTCYKSVRILNGPKHGFPTSMPEGFDEALEKLVVKVLRDVSRNG